MELLIKRDENTLVETDGKAFVDSDVPDFLNVPRVVPQAEVKSLRVRSSKDDLLICDGYDYNEIDNHFSSVHPRAAPGIWSGYRSALVREEVSNRLFRLKGISLNPSKPISTEMSDGYYRIEGGQEKQSAEYEKKMSDKFNNALASVGIEPVMEVKGLWKYPVLARKVRPVASVVEVKGDTRLDELMIVLEGLASRKMTFGRERTNGDGSKTIDTGEFSRLGVNYASATINLFQKIGLVTGKLKRLMDRSGQTWSSEYEQSNAHLGNIVLYNGTDKLKVGFVDFDASYDASELSRSELKAIQRREHDLLIRGAMAGPISPRVIKGRPFSNERLILNADARKSFTQGFETGYSFNGRSFTNEIDLGDLQEVFALLRTNGVFAFAPDYSHEEMADQEKYSTYVDIYGLQMGLYSGGKRINLEEVIRNQYGFQSGNYGLGKRKKKEENHFRDYGFRY